MIYCYGVVTIYIVTQTHMTKAPPYDTLPTRRICEQNRGCRAEQRFRFGLTKFSDKTLAETNDVMTGGGRLRPGSLLAGDRDFRAWGRTDGRGPRTTTGTDVLHLVPVVVDGARVKLHPAPAVKSVSVIPVHLPNQQRFQQSHSP